MVKGKQFGRAKIKFSTSFKVYPSFSSGVIGMIGVSSEITESSSSTSGSFAASTNKIGSAYFQVALIAIALHLVNSLLSQVKHWGGGTLDPKVLS